jgi:hypothetical protein
LDGHFIAAAKHRHECRPGARPSDRTVFIQQRDHDRLTVPIFAIASAVDDFVSSSCSSYLPIKFLELPITFIDFV